jgi:cytochrome c oxidase assembly protein subunit 15
MFNLNQRFYVNVSLLAVCLCFAVVVLGAFVRLSHAGLGCPDWPGCYGQVTWPKHAHEILEANQAFPERPVEVSKAWREMIHRFCAGILVLLVFMIAVTKNWSESPRRWLLAMTPVLLAMGTYAYTQALPILGAVFLIIVLAILMLGIFTWHGRAQARLAMVLLTLILVQALFGQWTVTLKLKPIIVTTHLVLGMTMLSLLFWFYLRSKQTNIHSILAPKKKTIISVIALVAIQIILGGWLSANYAALSCGVDFPRCIGQWWPHMNWSEALVIWRGVGVDYEGGVLDGDARIAIQMAHRLFACVVLLGVGNLALSLIRIPSFRTFGIALIAVLVLQIILGVSNIVLGLPLLVATAHNAGAACLLLILIALLSRAVPSRSANKQIICG